MVKEEVPDNDKENEVVEPKKDVKVKPEMKSTFTPDRPVLAQPAKKGKVCIVFITYSCNSSNSNSSSGSGYSSSSNNSSSSSNSSNSSNSSSGSSYSSSSI